MRPTPVPFELYRHFKGNIYQIKCIARHSETGESMVVYQAMYGDYSIYVRPLTMFMEEVDRGKYPDVQQRYRFEKLDDAGCGAKESVAASPAAEIARKPEAEKDGSGDMPAEGDNGVSEGYVDPRVIEFLDARTYEEKLTILAGMKACLTDDMLNIMAAAEDIEVKPGSIENRYEELKNCLVTLDRFECSRLR